MKMMMISFRKENRGVSKTLPVIIIIAIAVFGILIYRSLGGGAEMRWWTVHSGAWGHSEWHTYSLEEYDKLYGHLIERTDYDNPNFKSSILNAMLAGDPPEIWHSWGGTQLKNFVEMGYVEDLTDLMNESWALDILPLESRDKLIWNSTWNGKNYGFPYSVGVIQIYVNKDLFDSCGIDLPSVENDETWTWSQFIDAIQTLKNHGITPITIAGTETWQLSFWYMYLVDRIGGPEYFTKTLNRYPGYSFEDNVFLEAARKCRELVEMGAFQQTFMADGYDKAITMFSQGQAAMYLQGSWEIKTMKTYYNQNLNVDVIRFPLMDNSANGDPHSIVVNVQDYFCVSSTTKNKEAAFNFIRLLGREDVIRKFVEKAGDICVFDSRVGGGVDIPSSLYEPVINKQIEEFNNSTHTQMPWDQYSPQQFAQKHLECMKRLFDGTWTPEKVAQEHETIAQSLKTSGYLPVSYG
ncbi:MAG: extracellular solute-binding protein [Candidatus Hadarchaeales archaeon]